MTECPACGGKGVSVYSKNGKCLACGGRGQVSEPTAELPPKAQTVAEGQRK